MKQLPPDMPVLRDGGCSPGLHALTDLYPFTVGPEEFMGRQIVQMCEDGPDAYEALVF